MDIADRVDRVEVPWFSGFPSSGIQLGIAQGSRE